MATAFQERVVRWPHAVSPSIAARGAEVSMADRKGLVFVVDDDISVRESLEPLLKSAGWRFQITVKAHRGQVMRKMNAGSLAYLVTMAASLGLKRATP
jgi:hypothetical protein